MKKYERVSVIFNEVDVKDLQKLHIALVILLKSELNMCGDLKIFISTKENVLIELNSSIDLPLDINEFTRLINFVMTKMKVKDNQGTILMSVIKNKINDFLPPNSIKLKLDVRGGKLQSINSKEFYSIFINLNEDCDARTVRVSDYNMDKIGVCIQVINLFSSK